MNSNITLSSEDSGQHALPISWSVLIVLLKRHAYIGVATTPSYHFDF